MSYSFSISVRSGVFLKASLCIFYFLIQKFKLNMFMYELAFMDFNQKIKDSFDLHFLSFIFFLSIRDCKEMFSVRL